MKAIVYSGGSGPEKWAVRQVKKPETGDHEVLIRVHAATLTASDIGGMAFVVFSKLLRRFSARPEAIPGVEFAGIVEAAGSKVTRWKKGDRVFGSSGTSFGAWAEYICLPEDGVIDLMPNNMDFAEAAGICDGALTAFHFLMHTAKAAKGQSVLINGASGSVGTWAVQAAKHLGCSVTGVCSSSHMELVRSLGADRVIDYNQENFTRSDRTYDIVFDAVGKSGFYRCRKILKPKGIYLTTVPSPGILFDMLLTKFSGGKRALFAASGMAKRETKAEEIRLICGLMQTGKLRCIVDRLYPFEKIPEAVSYVSAGHKTGSVILTAQQTAGKRSGSIK